ncbi:MAG: hypothetical protein AB1485_04060 [Candidatus Thermoplasmatota archaeon]
MSSVKEKMRAIAEKSVEMQRGVEELSRKNEAAVKEIWKDIPKIQAGIQEKTKELAAKVKKMEERGRRFIKEFYG